MTGKDNNKEEELLILSDDSDTSFDFTLDDDIVKENSKDNSSDSIISFDDNNDFSIDSDNKEKFKSSDESDDSLLSFADENISSDEEIETITLDGEESGNLNLDNFDSQENIKSDLEDNSLDFSFEEEEKVPDNQEIEELKDDNSDSLFGEDINFHSVEDNSPINNGSASVGTMTDILLDTISKFEKREEVIISDIEIREGNIDELKKEISDLELKVLNENEEVSKLNSEKQAISKNIKSLEKMRSDLENPNSQAKK